jgi:hypothetical protein
VYSGTLTPDTGRTTWVDPPPHTHPPVPQTSTSTQQAKAKNDTDGCLLCARLATPKQRTTCMACLGRSCADCLIPRITPEQWPSTGRHVINDVNYTASGRCFDAVAAGPPSRRHNLAWNEYSWDIGEGVSPYALCFNRLLPGTGYLNTNRKVLVPGEWTWSGHVQTLTPPPACPHKHQPTNLHALTCSASPVNCC